MKRFIAYLIYVVKHKAFVFKAGVLVGAPIWRLIIHDWSKFTPMEFWPYAKTFYAQDGTKRFYKSKDFDKAWNHHQKTNKHHWEYWVMPKRSGGFTCLEMPNNYIREMVADWMGAGRAITGRWEVKEWYEANKHEIKLHKMTRIDVEMLINVYG